ncbi:DUF4271 domain-containing protein [Mangrovibacterium marinum]|nr:DUF4271 domain-containing protein [Mangrovibacterium marinum]
MTEILQPDDSLKTSLSTPAFKVLSNPTGKIDSAPLSSSGQAAASVVSSASTGQQHLQTHNTSKSEQLRSGAISLIPMRHPLESLRVETVAEPAIIGLALPEHKLPGRSADWTIGVLIAALVLFTSVRLFFGKYLKQMFHAAVNYATASRLYRERSVSLTHAAFRLDLLFALILSLFLFQIFGSQLSLGLSSSILKYLVIFGGVVVYFGFKQVVYSAQGKLTETNAETQEVLYNMNLYNRILGLGLVPVTLILAFSRLQNPEIIVGIGGIMALVCYILLVLRGLKILLRKDFPLFYLILYLCTLEILPLFFIYKLVLV